MLASYHERIERDLASFADPGGVDIEVERRTVYAQWKMRGDTREGTFTASADRGITVRTEEGVQPYHVFLADTRMADLRRMAQMIKRARPEEVFVPTRARKLDNGTTPEPATVLLTELLERDHGDATQVVMITGEAGTGKTRILQELVSQQAERYLQGQTDKLLLYVNAQGRALARLDEALATELQDLKANFTYHSVATLSRVGLLVPVIDGFDELLGVSGYDDAFSSLAAFLEELEGHGGLVASARSVYYEEEFLSRASRASMEGEQAWFHVPVEMVPWEARDQEEFLSAFAQRKSTSDEEKKIVGLRAHHVFEGNEALAAKPLFFARVVDLLFDEPTFSGGGDLLGELARCYLRRERREKLLDRQQRPILTEYQLELLMRELAEEMWNQETRELDFASVREVAEYALYDEAMPDFSRQIVLERMPTLAFLARSDRHGGLKFEHEIFFFYFLSRALADKYVQDEPVQVLLSRSTLPEFVADRLAVELEQQGHLSRVDALERILNRLGEAGQTGWRRAGIVQENAGICILALLRKFTETNGVGSEIEGCTIQSVVFPGGNLEHVTLRNCSLVDVEFRRTDLGTARFIGCTAKQVRLLEPRISVNSTRLELDGLRVPEDVASVQKLSDHGNSMIYAPSEIGEVLAQCGARVEMPGAEEIREVPKGLLEVMEKLIRAYARANPLCISEDRSSHLRRLVRDPQWPKVLDLLIGHGIVKLERRGTGGKRKEFLRRQFSPQDIMMGISRRGEIDPRVSRFWDALADLG